MEQSTEWELNKSRLELWTLNLMECHVLIQLNETFCEIEKIQVDINKHGILKISAAVWHTVLQCRIDELKEKRTDIVDKIFDVYNNLFRLNDNV